MPPRKRSRAAPPPASSRYVECPVCSASVPSAIINAHLDAHGLGRAALASSPTSPANGSTPSLTVFLRHKSKGDEKEAATPVPEEASSEEIEAASASAPSAARIVTPMLAPRPPRPTSALQPYCSQSSVVSSRSSSGTSAAARIGTALSESPLARAFGVTTANSPPSTARPSRVTAFSSYMPRFSGRAEDGGSYPGGGCLPSGGVATCDPRRMNVWHPRMRLASSSGPSYNRLLERADALSASVSLALKEQRAALDPDELHFGGAFLDLSPLGRALCAAALEEPGEWMRLHALPCAKMLRERRHNNLGMQSTSPPYVGCDLSSSFGGTGASASSAADEQRVDVCASLGRELSQATPTSDDTGTLRPEGCIDGKDGVDEEGVLAQGVEDSPDSGSIEPWLSAALGAGALRVLEVLDGSIMGNSGSMNTSNTGTTAHIVRPQGARQVDNSSIGEQAASPAVLGARAKRMMGDADGPPPRSSTPRKRAQIEGLLAPLSRLTMRQLRDLHSRYGISVTPKPQKGANASHAEELALNLLRLVSRRLSVDLIPLLSAIGPCVRLAPPAVASLRRLIMAGLAGAGYAPQPALSILRAYVPFHAAGLHPRRNHGVSADDVADHTTTKMYDARASCPALRSALERAEACVALADAADGLLGSTAGRQHMGNMLFQPTAHVVRRSQSMGQTTATQYRGNSFASEVPSLLRDLRCLMRELGDAEEDTRPGMGTLRRIASVSLWHVVGVCVSHLRREQRRAEATCLLAEAVLARGLPHTGRAAAWLTLAQQLQADGKKLLALELCETAHATGGKLTPSALAAALQPLIPTESHILCGSERLKKAGGVAFAAQGGNHYIQHECGMSCEAPRPSKAESMSEDMESEAGIEGFIKMDAPSIDAIELSPSQMLSARKLLLKLAVPPRRWKKPRVAELPSAPEVVVSARFLPAEPNSKGNSMRRGRWQLPNDGPSRTAGNAQRANAGCDTEWHVGQSPRHGGPYSVDTRTYSHFGVTDYGEAAWSRAQVDGTGSVEQVALWHYMQRGWRVGLHLENSLPLTIFALILWDALFEALPGVMDSAAQDAPADLWDSRFFYRRRRSKIDESLRRVRAGEARQMLIASHAAHYGTPAVGVTWGRFDLRMLSDVAEALGGNAVAALCAALASDYASWSHGFPDLLVFNPAARDSEELDNPTTIEGTHPALPSVDLTTEEVTESGVKLIEVKGPGDRLSDAQIAWIGLLLREGVSVEVCRVKAEH